MPGTRVKLVEDPQPNLLRTTPTHASGTQKSIDVNVGETGTGRRLYVSHTIFVCASAIVHLNVRWKLDETLVKTHLNDGKIKPTAVQARPGAT